MDGWHAMGGHASGGASGDTVAPSAAAPAAAAPGGAAAPQSAAVVSPGTVAGVSAGGEVAAAAQPAIAGAAAAPAPAATALTAKAAADGSAAASRPAKRKAEETPSTAAAAAPTKTVALSSGEQGDQPAAAVAAPASTSGGGGGASATSGAAVAAPTATVPPQADWEAAHAKITGAALPAAAAAAKSAPASAPAAAAAAEPAAPVSAPPAFDAPAATALPRPHVDVANAETATPAGAAAAAPTTAPASAAPDAQSAPLATAVPPAATAAPASSAAAAPTAPVAQTADEVWKAFQRSKAAAAAGQPPPRPLQPVHAKVTRDQMHRLREALRGPDPHPLMERLGLRPNSVPFFMSLNFRFYLGDIGTAITCGDFVRRFNKEHTERCLTVLENFDELSNCRWSRHNHALFSATDQASIAALFSVCADGSSSGGDNVAESGAPAAAPAVSAVTSGDAESGDSGEASSAAESAAAGKGAAAPEPASSSSSSSSSSPAQPPSRSRPPMDVMELVLSHYVRRGWFEPPDASDIEVSLTDLPPHPEEEVAQAAASAAGGAGGAGSGRAAKAAKAPVATPDDKMATDFVTQVKERCTDAAYKIFLETLEQSRHQDSASHPTTTTLLLEINQTMQELFKDEPDLFSGFSQFMPQDRFSGLKNLTWFNSMVKMRREHVAALRARGRMLLEDRGFAGCVLAGHTGHFKNFMGLYALEDGGPNANGASVFKKVEPVHRPPFNPNLDPPAATAAAVGGGAAAVAAPAAPGQQQQAAVAAAGQHQQQAAVSGGDATGGTGAGPAPAPLGPARIEDRYIFCADDGRWWVGDEEDKSTGASVGWLVTSRCCDMPSDGTAVGWEVWKEGRTYVTDPDLVCVVSPGLVQRLRREAKERAAREDKRLARLLAEKGGVSLTGHTGRYSILMGYYATLKTQMINDAAVFAHQASGEPKRYLYRGHDGRWWVSDHEDMNNGRARGWLKSDRPDYGSPGDARWEVFDRRLDAAAGVQFFLDAQLKCTVSQVEVPVLFKHTRNRKTKKARLMKQSVLLEGHTAGYASLMGVYVLHNKKEEVPSKMVFRLLGQPEDRFLYRGRSGRWWVGSASHRMVQQQPRPQPGEGTGWLVTAEACDFPKRHTTWHVWSKETQSYVLDPSICCTVPKQSTVLSVSHVPRQPYHYGSGIFGANSGWGY